MLRRLLRHPQAAGTCAAHVALTLGEPAVGSTRDAAAAHTGTCADGGARPEAVYLFQPPAAGPACLSTIGSLFDTVLDVRRAPCQGGAELACNDDFGFGAGGSQLEIEAAAATPYSVFVDGFGEDTSGAYVLNATAEPCPVR